MKRLFWVLITVVVVAGLVLGGCDGTTEPTNGDGNGGELPLGEPIRCAALVPTSGPFVRCQGIYNMYKIRADEVNAAGGLVAGGERHMIEYTMYDDGGFSAVVAAASLRDAYANDNVSFTWGTSSLPFMAATGRVATEYERLHMGWGATYLSPDFPYLIGAESGYDYNRIAVAHYLAENYGAKRIAIAPNDSPNTAMVMAMMEAGALSAGLEIVYAEPWPAETTDFMPMMTRILATEPDVIDIGATPAAAGPHLMQAARDLGYEGFFIQDDWMLAAYAEVMDIEYLDQKCFGLFSMYGASGMPPEAKNLYDEWVARWGAENYDPYMSISYECGTLMEIGIIAADSIDPTKVRDALLAMSEITVPIFGESAWGGMERFGVNNHLMTPTYFTMVDLSTPANFVNIGPIDIPGILEQHHDIIFEVFARYGMLYEE